MYLTFNSSFRASGYNIQLFPRLSSGSSDKRTELLHIYILMECLFKDNNKNTVWIIHRYINSAFRLRGHSCSDHTRTHTDGVDVRLVACEGLPAHAVPDVPQFDRGVAGPWHKGAEVWRQGQTHNVTGVACENRRLLTCLDIPQCTGGESA